MGPVTEIILEEKERHVDGLEVEWERDLDGHGMTSCSIRDTRYDEML